jgi:hypothetical protein
MIINYLFLQTNYSIYTNSMKSFSLATLVLSYKKVDCSEVIIGSLEDYNKIFYLFIFIDYSLKALPLFLYKGYSPSIVRFISILNPTLLLYLLGMKGIIINKILLVK